MQEKLSNYNADLPNEVDVKYMAQRANGFYNNFIFNHD